MCSCVSRCLMADSGDKRTGTGVAAFFALEERAFVLVGLFRRDLVGALASLLSSARGGLFAPGRTGKSGSTAVVLGSFGAYAAVASSVMVRVFFRTGFGFGLSAV